MASPATPQDQQVNFDLDAEKVVSSKTPFAFRAKAEDGEERLVTLIDPEEIDWRVLMQIEEPKQFFSAALTPDDRRFMRKVPTNGATFRKLIEAYTRYYGLDNPGNGVGSGF